MADPEVTITFTIADLPVSAFKNREEAVLWLMDSKRALSDSLSYHGNVWITGELEDVDGREVDWDLGHFEASEGG